MAETTDIDPTGGDSLANARVNPRPAGSRSGEGKHFPPMPNQPAQFVQFEIGARFKHNGKVVEIRHCLRLDEFVVHESQSDDLLVVPRSELTPLPATPSPEPSGAIELDKVSKEQFAQATAREKATKELLRYGVLSQLDAHTLARTFGVSSRTIRRWVVRYKAQPDFTAFLDKPRGPKPGHNSLDQTVEAIIRHAVRLKLKTSGNCSVRAVRATIRADCRNIGIGAPADSTILDRIKALKANPDNLPVAVAKKVRERTQPVRGSVEVERPLEHVQIDHTLVDTHIVDPFDREDLGRPWFTVAIDTLTRVVPGFLLSLEAPSRLSVALCLRHAIFPKEAWLRQIGVAADWPVFGRMEKVFTDNAPEFISPSFKMGCERLHIKPELRPVGEPRYGGIVERLIGTLMRRLRLLPGNTYNEILKGRSPYPAASACLTLEALVAIFVNEICAYHNERHSSLRTSPLAAWKSAWRTPSGIIVPSYPADPHTIFVNLLPHATRRLSREGIHIHSLQYRSPELEPYLKPEARGVIRTDPRDISSVFADLPGDRYLQVPWVNKNWPQMSLCEWDEIRAKDHRRDKTADSEVVRLHLEANNQIIAAEAQKGKLRARRRIARAREWRKVSRSEEESLTPRPRTRLDVSTSSVDSSIAFEVLE
jgi:putative transposase